MSDNNKGTIVFITDHYPILAYSGGSTGAYGMADCLRNLNYKIEVCYVGHNKDFKKKARVSAFKIYDCSPNQSTSSIHLVRQILEETKPILVWIHPVLAWPYFAPFAAAYPHIMMAGDPMDKIIKYRFKFSTNANRGMLRRILTWYRYQKSAKQARESEVKFIREANRKGVACTFSPGDIAYRKETSGVNIELCELALPDLKERIAISGLPNFLVLGNLTTVHTRYGLEYFFKSVWPLWKVSDLPEKSSLRIVGGGKLPPNITIPKDETGLNFVGFAESLDEEFSNTAAAIVTVPIDIGFRTRVVESWNKGVPVIMDGSSAQGLPTAKHEYNCLIANHPKDFISHAERILEEDGLKEKLAKGGRATFEEYYQTDSTIVLQRFQKVVEKALEKFTTEV